MKKLVALLTLTVLIGAGAGFAYASTSDRPADIYAELTGITVDEAYDLKLESDKTFGELAQEAGIYEEFQAASLDAKTVMIEEMVANGELTQEEADEILAALATCDGTSQGILKDALNLGQKLMNGQGRQNGSGRGCGSGNCDGTAPSDGTGSQIRQGGNGRNR